MTPDDLTRPLKPAARKRRRGIVLLIVAGSFSGVLTGLAVLIGAGQDRSKSLPPAPVPQPAPADAVEKTAVLPPPSVTVPTAKPITITVIDSQTGAKREVVLPPQTNDEPAQADLSRDVTATIPPTGARRRTAIKAKRP